MHHVVALALNSVVVFDLSIPAQVFGHRREAHYRFTACSPTGDSVPPRISRFGAWSALINVTRFASYHLWRTWDRLNLILILAPTYYLVWRPKDIRIGIAVHIAINGPGWTPNVAPGLLLDCGTAKHDCSSRDNTPPASLLRRLPPLDPARERKRGLRRT